MKKSLKQQTGLIWQNIAVVIRINSVAIWPTKKQSKTNIFAAFNSSYDVGKTYLFTEGKYIVLALVI